MEIITFAPVCIPTLCRYDHFKRCVESLSRCTHADKTDLIIALDFPLKDSHKAGYEKISEYISSITGFKNVITIRREKNYGAVKNSYDIILTVFEKYERLIFTEDDDEFSPNFLDFINKGLEKFENDEEVYAICGYHFPYSLKNYANNVYSSHAISAWGIGYWRHKYMPVTVVVYNFTFIKTILSSWNKSFKLYSRNFSIINDLISQQTKNMLCEDCLITAYLLNTNKYCIFPTVSKVRNWGQDGSGEHSGDMGEKEFIYTHQKIDQENTFHYDDILIEEKPEVRKMIKRTHYRSIIIRFVIFTRFSLYMLFKRDILKFYLKTI